MPAVIGRAFDDPSDAQLGRAVDELLTLHRDRTSGADSVVLLPEAHYPFHPSTGLVTAPTVVRAAVESLSRSIDPGRLTVAIAGSPSSPAPQVAEYLGYPDLLADTVAHLAFLGETRQTFDDEGVAVPSLLADSLVVTVPTLRRSPAVGLIAGMGTLARALTVTPDAAAIATATSVVSPGVTLLDGSYVFDGTPSKPSFLLASDDAEAVDQVCSELLGLDSDAVPYLDAPPYDPASVLEGVRLRSVKESIRTGARRTDGGSEPNGFVTAGYRLYSRLSGDALPPQFLDRGDSGE